MLQTTSLFVELLVIGVGAALWVVLLVMACLGPGAVPLVAVLSPEGLLLALPFVYLLGILTDRLADQFLGKGRSERIFKEVFPETGARSDYYKGRRFIMHHSGPLYELLEYGRSRLRICRGWCFNGAAGLIAWLLLWCRWPSYEISTAVGITGAVLLLGLVLLCWWSWCRLVLADYEKVRRQAPYLAHTEDDRRAMMREIGERWETEDHPQETPSDPSSHQS